MVTFGARFENRECLGFFCVECIVSVMTSDSLKINISFMDEDYL